MRFTPRQTPPLAISLILVLAGCSAAPVETYVNGSEPVATERRHLLERIDDTGVIQLYADGFDDLSLRDKVLCFHLANAAIAGRDIFIDQKFEHSLAIRDLLEELYMHRADMAASTAKEIERYTKLFWLNNGIHDHVTTKKRLFGLSLAEYQLALRAARKSGANLPSAHVVSELYSVMSDPNTFESCTNKSPDNDGDPLEASCNNLYSGVSTIDLARVKELYPLNSRLVKRGGTVSEEVYRIGDPKNGIPRGRYAVKLSRVVKHLRLAAEVAPEKTRVALEHLIKYYHTGDPKDWHDYNVAWVKDNDSVVDTINGFIEVYVDARGIKDCRREVHEPDQIVDCTLCGDTVAPANRQRHMDAEFVAVRLGARKGHSVVGSDNDERIV